MAVERLFSNELRLGDHILGYMYPMGISHSIDVTITRIESSLDGYVARLSSGGQLMLSPDQNAGIWCVERRTVEEMCRDIVRWL